MEQASKKQLFHGLRVFGIAVWAIIALIASTVCWKQGTTVGENIFGALNLLIHLGCITAVALYDIKKEKEEV